MGSVAGGTTDEMMAASTCRSARPSRSNKPVQGRRVLVGGALAARLHAPVEAQRLAVEQPEGRVRVADVDHDEHGLRAIVQDSGADCARRRRLCASRRAVVGMGRVGVTREPQPQAGAGGAPAVRPVRRAGGRASPRASASCSRFRCALFAGFWVLDAAYFGRRTAAADGRGAWQLLVELDAETLQNALGSLAQVVVAVLGIAITVVSIVVQLAATRYTPRIAEMFFRDKKNLAIMGFFVVACINAVWVSIVVTGGFVPRATVAMTTVVVTASLLLLIPYFAYVFAFLDPEKVIARIGHQVLDAVLARGTWPARAGRPGPAPGEPA